MTCDPPVLVPSRRAGGYRQLRADASAEPGKRLQAALGRLLDDPAAARGESARWETLHGKVWALSVIDPGDRTWMILWAEQLPDVIEVFYVGPAPGETHSGVAWTSQSG